MTDTPYVPPATSAGYMAEPLTVPTIVYILYGMAFFMPPLAVVGIIMAHTGSSNAGPVARTHFAYQTRTFWYGLLMLMIAGALGMSYAIVNLLVVAWEHAGSGNVTWSSEGVPPVLIVSGAIFFWWFLWTLVRDIKGFITLVSRAPMPKPKTLLW